ncbi:MAG: efflux RND transporter periplasmic adaptor subunit [Acidobacteriota bacterium]
MRTEVGRTARWPALVMSAVALVALGATGSYILMRGSIPAAHDGAALHEQDTPARTAALVAATAAEGPLPDVTLTLTPEAVQRAGITMTPVRRRAVAGAIRVPGNVEPNAYRQVVATSLVAGRLTSVSVALGDRVARGQLLAEVYSPELADVETRYLTMLAEFDAAHQQLSRMERLVEIGAASAQELETARTGHMTHDTDVQGARARLTLLGLGADEIARLKSASDITATVGVAAALSGVVTKRDANVGMNVDPATQLFTIVDLSSVWVIAELYERDFPAVTIGRPVTVTTAAYPGLALQGTVSYIDPRVSADTRTAKLRVEVPNAGQQLRLGMFVDVSVTGAAAEALVVPRAAVQTVGGRQVVYLATPQQPGTFIERDVQLGETIGADVQITSGVEAGDSVVGQGSFSLRAERERLGLRSSVGAPVPHQH